MPLIRFVCELLAFALLLLTLLALCIAVGY
jgi:hypothetical protein